MRVFVTGGTGFIGTHVVSQLLSAGHEVVALRRPGSSTRIPLHLDPEWIDGNLTDNHRTVLATCDVFMHLAAHTPNPPYGSLEECLYWNVTASLSLAEQALMSGITHYIIAGSCFEYGNSISDTEPLSPATPLAPSLSYPTSKAAASVAFTGWARDKGLRLKLIRIFQAYGIGEAEQRLWPSLCNAAVSGRDFPMTKGEQVRDFIPVEDVARCFVQSLLLEDVENGNPVITHAATGNPQTLYEFSEKIWTSLGATGKLKLGDIPYRRNEIMRIVSHPNALDPAIIKVQ